MSTIYAENKMANACRYIDDAIHPTNMSLEEAKEFLEALQMEIESRLESLKENIRQENETVEKDIILSRGGDDEGDAR